MALLAVLMLALLLWVAWTLVASPPAEPPSSTDADPTAPALPESGDAPPETQAVKPAPIAPPVAGGSDASADVAKPRDPAAVDASPPPGRDPRPPAARDVVASSDADPTLVDGGLPDYAPPKDALSELRSVGSDTVSAFVIAWGEDLSRLAPGFRLTVEARGSATAPPALMEGRADLGPMAREMLATERDAYREKTGREPRGVRVAVQAVAVFVHPANPLRSLSLAELDAMFSATRRRFHEDITTWGDLGLTGEWADKKINLYGRNQSSGAHGLFKESVLKKGDFRGAVNERPGSPSVVQSVSEDRYAIGYADLSGGGVTGVRVVPIAATDSGTAFGPDAATVASGDYPLARFLRVYFDAAPDSPRAASVREFLRFALSKQGQRCVVRYGFIPLTATIADAERALVGD